MRLRFLGSLDVCPGESSTQTLFLRVMDTFDDDDDDDDDGLAYFVHKICGKTRERVQAKEKTIYGFIRTYLQSSLVGNNI